MNYYTDFRLRVFQGNADLAAVKARLEEIVATDEETGQTLFDQLDEGDDEIKSFGEIRWYEHDEDCAVLSLDFPGTVFRLEGYGQERSDEWHAYYKDGKIQECRGEMVFPEYSESKLENLSSR